MESPKRGRPRGDDRQRGRGRDTGLPRDGAAMTFEEIAQVLGITRGGVWMAYQSAMRKLQRFAMRNTSPFK